MVENKDWDIIVCPKCGKQLSTMVTGSNCSQCGFEITINDDGFIESGLDFFKDYDHDQIIDELKAGKEPFKKDRLIIEDFTLKFSIPLLERLFASNNENDIKVLSAGCGIGSDVDILRDIGYQAWGNDSGSRCVIWSTRKYKTYLIRCLSEHLPFPDDYFDIVQCHQVLEHIGVVDDTMTLKANFPEIRQNFLNSLLRVVKPKGYLHVSTPNRLFPIDPGHGHNFHGLRFHGPLDYFLNSFSDIKSYFPDKKVIALSPLNYYTGQFMQKHILLNKMFNSLLHILDRHEFARKTFINPLTNVLIQK